MADSMELIFPQLSPCFYPRSLSQAISIQSTYYSSKIHFNIIRPPTSRSSYCSRSSRFSEKYSICIHLLPIRATCPTNLILGWVKYAKVKIFYPIGTRNPTSRSSSPQLHLTSCTVTKFNLHFYISFAAVISEPAIYRLFTSEVPNLIPISLSLGGLSPWANYTERATATCRRNQCQPLRIKGTTWSAWRIPTAVFSTL
jgi:hypothetical protein